MIFNKVNKLYSYHPNSDLEHFHHPNKIVQAHLEFISKPTPGNYIWGGAEIHPLWIHPLCIFHIYGSIQHTVCASAFFHLACFWSSSCISMYLYFISFYCQIVFHCMDITHFIFPLIGWQTFGLFVAHDYYE